MALREVESIDYVDRVLITTDQQRFRIEHLFDACGRETSNPKAAVLCIAGEQGAWLSVRLGSYDRAKLQ